MTTKRDLEGANNWKSISVKASNKYHELIDQLVQSGAYQSKAHAIRTALDLLAATAQSKTVEPSIDPAYGLESIVTPSPEDFFDFVIEILDSAPEITMLGVPLDLILEPPPFFDCIKRRISQNKRTVMFVTHPHKFRDSTTNQLDLDSNTTMDRIAHRAATKLTRECTSKFPKLHHDDWPIKIIGHRGNHGFRGFYSNERFWLMGAFFADSFKNTVFVFRKTNSPISIYKAINEQYQRLLLGCIEDPDYDLIQLYQSYSPDYSRTFTYEYSIESGNNEFFKQKIL